MILINDFIKFKKEDYINYIVFITLVPVLTIFLFLTGINFGIGILHSLTASFFAFFITYLIFVYANNNKNNEKHKEETKNKNISKKLEKKLPYNIDYLITKIEEKINNRYKGLFASRTLTTIQSLTKVYKDNLEKIDYLIDIRKKGIIKIKKKNIKKLIKENKSIYFKLEDYLTKLIKLDNENELKEYLESFERDFVLVDKINKRLK